MRKLKFIKMVIYLPITIINLSSKAFDFDQKRSFEFPNTRGR